MLTIISSQRASKAFSAILEALGRDDLQEILSNWNDNELSEDGKTIICYIGRDREYSKGREGGKVTIPKKEFIEWLLGDGPFDQAVYGPKIREDVDWTTKIMSAREATGLWSELPKNDEK